MKRGVGMACAMQGSGIPHVETYESTGPYGAKSIGEVPINCPAPAIANAIYDAVGVRIFDLPMTAEKILAALKNM